VLHVIAFIVIGIVVGALFIKQSRGAAATIRVIAGLVGGLLGGFVSLAILGSGTTKGKYGSLVIAIIVALILSALAQRGTEPASSRS